MMGKFLDDKINQLPEKRRAKVLARANELIQAELSLREIRHLRHKTQEQLAIILQKRQDEISRLEKRSDFLVSTLQEYIEALGGHLKLIAEFNDSPAVILNWHADKIPKKRT